MTIRSESTSGSQFSYKSQSGQIAVIVFLIMAILLVVGLSLATRTSQEIELAGQQEDTTRVFNAAETGIERALSDQSNFGSSQVTIPIPADAETQAATTVTITPQTGFENTFQSGETATVFTNKVASTQTFSILWTKEQADCSSILAVTVYTEPTTNNFAAQHYGIRPGDCAAAFSTTNFTASNVGTPSDSAYKYQHNLTAPANTVMVRIKPLRGSTTIKVVSSILDEQLYNIRSQAQDTTSGNTEVRAIEVTRSRPAPPSIFDYAIYSGAALTK